MGPFYWLKRNNRPKLTACDCGNGQQPHTAQCNTSLHPHMLHAMMQLATMGCMASKINQDHLPCYLILSSLEFDQTQLAACHAGPLKQKKQEACLLPELPAGLMHLETAGNSQWVCTMHQLVTKLTWCPQCDLTGCFIDCFAVIGWFGRSSELDSFLSSLIDCLLDCSWTTTCSIWWAFGLINWSIDGFDGWWSKFWAG